MVLQFLRWLGEAAFSTGARRELTGILGHIVKAYAAILAVWTVYAAVLSSIDVLALTIIFLSAMLVLVFLLIGATAKAARDKPSVADVCLAGLSLVTGGFFVWSIPEIATRISLLTELSDAQRLFAGLIILLTLEATRRTVGMGLAVIAGLFMVYNLFGHHISGAFGHGLITLDHFVDINVYTSDGLFGIPLRVAATYAFLFVLFGTFLDKARGGDFFFDLAASVSGRSPGGPAKVAVFSSGLFGTVSGSPTSDVVTTGAITIPMMKRLGYSGTLAGAVEVAASTGGSLLPPVMGSAAFIMAEYAGIDYADIIVAAAVPGLLYYVSIFIQVHLRSVRLGLAPLPADRLPNLAATLVNGWIFIAPLAVMVWGLLEGYSATYVALFGAIAMVAISQVRKSSRITPRMLYDGLAETTMRMIGVTGACAAAGLVIGGITMTGLAAKFSHLVFLFTDSGMVLPALIVGALVTILLGLGMPTPSAYVLAAVLVGPTLVNEFGIPLMGAHLFLLYFAAMSAMTPPVAVAAYAAAAIAGANPLAIAVQAVGFSIAAFVIPFAFIYTPGIIMEGSTAEIVAGVFEGSLAIVSLAFAAEGFLKARLSAWVRLALVACALVLLAQSGWIALAAGAVAVGLLVMSYRDSALVRASNPSAAE